MSHFVAGNTAICERVAVLERHRASRGPRTAGHRGAYRRSQRLRREGYQALGRPLVQDLRPRPGSTEATASTSS